MRPQVLITVPILSGCERTGLLPCDRYLREFTWPSLSLQILICSRETYVKHERAKFVVAEEREHEEVPGVWGTGSTLVSFALEATLCHREWLLHRKCDKPQGLWALLTPGLGHSLL